MLIHRILFENRILYYNSNYWKVYKSKHKMSIDIREVAKNRILVIDGAMGTMLQQYKLTEADFRTERFADHPCDVKGNNDIL
jgi:hypothetical protein